MKSLEHQIRNILLEKNKENLKKKKEVIPPKDRPKPEMSDFDPRVHLKKEENELEELSKETLGSYVTGAQKQIDKTTRRMIKDPGSITVGDDQLIQQRKTGIDLAKNKIQEDMTSTASAAGSKALQKTREGLLKSTKPQAGSDQTVQMPIPKPLLSPHTMLNHPSFVMNPHMYLPKEKPGPEAKKSVSSARDVGNKSSKLASAAGGGKNSSTTKKKVSEDVLSEFKIEKLTPKHEPEVIATKQNKITASKQTKSLTTPKVTTLTTKSVEPDSISKKTSLTPKSIESKPIEVKPQPVINKPAVSSKETAIIKGIGKFLKPLAAIGSAFYPTPAGKGSELTPEIKQKLLKTKEKTRPIEIYPTVPAETRPDFPKAQPKEKPEIKPQIAPLTKPEVSPDVKPKILLAPITIGGTSSKQVVVPGSKPLTSPQTLVKPQVAIPTPTKEPVVTKEKPKVKDISVSSTPPANPFRDYGAGKYLKPRTKIHTARMHVKEGREDIDAIARNHTSRKEVEYVGRKDPKALTRHTEIFRKIIEQKAVKKVEKIVKEKKYDDKTRRYGETVVNPELNQNPVDVREGALSKIASKVTPGIGAAYGAMSSLERIKQKDYPGAALSAASALPVVGIPAAVLDVARDYQKSGESGTTPMIKHPTTPGVSAKDSFERMRSIKSPTTVEPKPVETSKPRRKR